MATAAILHSDHVNLLVFRYLQESGFESAAIAFSKDWHRPSIFRDPEHLPFAHEVQRNELITLIQTGLYHDELSERVRRAGRRFPWSQIDARASIERPDGLDNGAETRPTSSGRRKERPLVARSQDDFPTPAPKRRRRSEGSEPQVNGERDATGVDAASAGGEEEGDSASAAGASEPEIIERYDSMEVGTQTVIKTGPKTSTITWALDKPGANVLEAIWNPNSKSNDSQTLMTVGESLCRFYHVPDSLYDTKQLTHVDEPSLPAESAVTAAMWHPDGQGACCAVDAFRDLPSGSKKPMQLLLENRQESTSTSLQLGPPTLEPPGIILAVWYSPNGEYVLALRTNETVSMIQVWRSTHSATEDSVSTRGTVAWRLFDTQVNDVTWIADDTFLVCGNGGLASLYQVDGSQHKDAGALHSGSAAMCGLISHNSSMLDGNSTWDKLRYDRSTGVALFASLAERRMFLTSRLRDRERKGEEDAEVTLSSNGNLVALEIQPTQEGDVKDTQRSSCLAAAFDDGSCHIYSIGRSDSGTTCTDLVTLTLSEPPATALTWSPDGAHLAICGSDMIQIWSTDFLIRKNGISHPPRPIVTWRATAEAHDAPIEHEGEEDDVEPSVNWSANGQSLAFAAKRQVSIIRFVPPLQGEATTVQPHINGHDDP